MMLDDFHLQWLDLVERKMFTTMHIGSYRHFSDRSYKIPFHEDDFSLLPSFTIPVGHSLQCGIFVMTYWVFSWLCAFGRHGVGKDCSWLARLMWMNFSCAKRMWDWYNGRQKWGRTGSNGQVFIVDEGE